MNFRMTNVDTETCNDLFADSIARLVDECRELIKERLQQLLFSGVSCEALAKQLWQGGIKPASIAQAVFGQNDLVAFAADLSSELGSLVAGAFYRPVLLRVDTKRSTVLEDQVKILDEQLAWGQETHMLNQILMITCQLVWKQAVSDSPWLVRKLKIGNLIWRLTGSSPAEEERRCQQDLARTIEGIKINLQKRLFNEIAIQVAAQIWSLYDGQTEKETSGLLVNPETDTCA